MKSSLRRLAALVRKEVRQCVRERSNLAVGLLLPVTLILLFGYGMSFDVQQAPIAVVLHDRTPAAHAVFAGLKGSPYLAPIREDHLSAAEARLRDHQVDAIVHFPPDFARRLAAGNASVQLILNGANTTTAQTLEGYIQGALAGVLAQQAARAGGGKAVTGARVELVQRLWFNPAGVSTWYLVPGLVVLVLTLIGALMTSLLIAREWERGTLEALFVTPVRPLELLLAKLAPYLSIGALNLVLCLAAARFLFAVPIHASLWVIFATALLYLCVSLLLGLLISGLARNQFLASQLALLVSFLPATMLSGFVFDLRNVPLAIQIVSNALPATHFMRLIKTLFLAGNNWGEVARTSLILGGYALLLIWCVQRTLKKTLDGHA